MAAEYDGVVAARPPAPMDGPEESGLSPDEQVAVRARVSAERLARRARLQRRLTWTLVGAVLFALFLKWWY